MIEFSSLTPVTPNPEKVPAMPQRTQTLANHARYVPMYHFVAAGLIAIYLYSSVARVVHQPTRDHILELCPPLALAVVYWYARVFALAAQDRVIRLELRLRLEHLLPPQQFARFDELAAGQVVALRFASDAELPGLVAEVLDGKLVQPGDIKRRIQNWQSDWWRV